MASELRIYERPTLDRPVLIAAFRGWNDGGQAAPQRLLPSGATFATRSRAFS
jgi:hypothetical protein